MRAFVLQDWVTIRGASTISSVVQNEANYLSLDSFQDAIIWLQVAEISTGSGTVTMNLETAPLKDETLFLPMTGCSLSVTAPLMTPKVIPVVMNQSATLVPLSRYLRWRVAASATATWDLTFRVLVSANQIFTFNPRWTAGNGVSGM